MHQGDGHFIKQRPKQNLPAKIIRVSSIQKQAMDGILGVFARYEEGGDGKRDAHDVDKVTTCYAASMHGTDLPYGG